MSRNSTSYQETCLAPEAIAAPTTPTGTLPCGAVLGGGVDGGGGEPGGPDVNCNDPVYAAAHPDRCGAVARLALQPSQASVVVGDMVRYTTVMTQNGTQIPLTLGLLYSSSDPAIATIDANTGLATGVNTGVVTITVTWHTLTAFAQLTVVDSCADVTSDFVIVIDKTKSMGQAFDVNYASKLHFAKAAARSFAATINYATDNVAVVEFSNTTPSATSADIVLGFSSDASSVDSAIAGVPQTQNYTTLQSGVKTAALLLAASPASRKIIVLFTDGEDRPPSVVQGDSPLDIATGFTGAGNILMVVGVRAYGTGFTLLNAMASGGFFLNAYAGNTVTTIATLNTFTGYVCSNNGGGYVITSPDPQSPDPSPLPDAEPPIVGPGGGGGGAQTYSYTATATAYCPGNDVGDPATASITYVSSISPADAQQHAQIQAQAAASAQLNCCRNGVISIPQVGIATPNPACYKVTGFSGTVTSVQLVLDKLSHASFSDIEAVLVGPQGQACVILRGAGKFHDGGGHLVGPTVTNLQMAFADGSPSLAVDVPVVSGTWAPTDTQPLAFPANPAAPQQVLGHALSVFNGTDPNGIWHLYVYDTAAPDIGSIGSWFMVINGVAACDCAGSPNHLAIHGGAGGLSQLNPACGATSANPPWDGTGINRDVSGCRWITPIMFSTKSAVGKKIYQATVDLISLSGQCYYQLAILATAPGPAAWWIGRKSGAFGSGPAGVYNIVPVACSNTGPLTIQLDAA